nr:unnamed protein product [Digitaria exilis]
MTEVLLLVDGGPMTEILLLLDGGLMAEDGGCNYWAWAEGPHSEFIQEMLRDLRNEVWRVKRKNGELKALMTEMEEKEKHKEKDIQAMRVTGWNDPLGNDRMAEKTLTSPAPLLPSRRTSPVRRSPLLPSRRTSPRAPFLSFPAAPLPFAPPPLTPHIPPRAAPRRRRRHLCRLCTTTPLAPRDTVASLLLLAAAAALSAGGYLLDALVTPPPDATVSGAGDLLPGES